MKTIAEEQATKETTPECIKTFFRQLRFFKRTRKCSIYLTIFFTILVPFQLASELFRLSQEFTREPRFDSYPKECTAASDGDESRGEENCLRVDLNKNLCVGERV